jgi:4-hydroxythreonine-4-phosphate dehydrogenase
MYRPRLVISLGDPAGIGPEVILRALADEAIAQSAEIVIVGSTAQIQQAYDRLSEPLANPDDLKILNIDTDDPICIGIGDATSGAASFRYLEHAIDATLAGNFDAIVTAPIAKSAWKAAGHFYPGQTELLAEKAGVNCFGMLFVARSPHTNWTLRALLATTHIPLSEVANALTPTLLTLKLDLLMESLQQDFGIEQPQIAIAGLNPHSGEQGQLGREEADWIDDWLVAMHKRYPNAILKGLLPPDTMWVEPGKAWYGHHSPKLAADGYLALYHDQGLIPVKLMAFDRAVNTTIGLPFIRTSPDHGTAFDIARQGIADPTSMKAAIQLAIDLTLQKRDQSARNLPNWENCNRQMS